ncbi:tyrosine-type recombinase/integrase [Algoriphagus sp. D3-2-R+10]|uniref:tyrosine-type recombinase/integrase n=1 Tax=Algoriphagus aurantiacus TaxID=3103948 RepID=UPI002B3904F3|nr:hypothetical protein [Algoriphagus sp. D3-2-R+10]MEB2775218.1 tyrosine-type recombinase/integrase [Algoriphagus sp. D3-2-R+10]
MKAIFFIKDASKSNLEPNSIVLRFYLKSKKYKVKGLGIKCCKKDFNQEEQKIKRSNQFYQKYNKRLNFIVNELEKIEEKREIIPEDIDLIVEASIKDMDIKKVISNSENLKMLITKYVESLDVSNYKKNTRNNYINALLKVERFEAYNNVNISITDLLENITSLQEEIINWCRNVEGNKDSSIKMFFNNLNTCIIYYNNKNNKNIPTFNHKDNNYKIEEKEIIYLTKDELSKLYNFVYNPNEEMQGMKRPEEKHLKYVKYFLFRCFCGMRVSEMHSNNINPQRLNPFTKDLEARPLLVNKDLNFSYFATKNNKIVKVPYIGNYLYDIARSLDWDFPDLTVHKDLMKQINREQYIVGKVLKMIYGDNIRKIETMSNGKYYYKNLSECISSHTARKSFAYIIYNINKDILQVMNCLGHSSIEVTRKYLGIEYDNKSIESFRLDL